MKKLIFVVAGFLIVATALPVFAQTTSSGYGYVYPQPSYGCPQIWSNMARGSSDYYLPAQAGSGGQVSQLQQFLSTRYYQPVTGYYGAITWSNVARFQREQSVYPITGGVGPLTRAAIARVCGGMPTPIPTPIPYPTPIPPYPTYNAPSINGISGPSQLSVGQQGTWALNVADTSSYLSYSVVWGDEQVYDYAMAAQAPQAISSSGSLTHAYASPGTYSPRFTVTNAYGQSASASASVQVSGGTVCGMTQSYPGNPIYCPPQGTVSAYPQSGPAPLSVTFSPSLSAGGYYAVDFGDGSSASMLQGSVQHLYYNRGTYTAQFSSDMACMHSNPRCMIATQIFGTATITVY